MSDQVEWLNAQIDADEASEWPHRPSCQMMRNPGMSCNCDAADRWYREIEAKRRIIAEHLKAEYRDECRRCFDPDTAPGDYDFETFPCPTLRALALPYADRPGYDAERWAP